MIGCPDWIVSLGSAVTVFLAAYEGRIKWLSDLQDRT